MLRMISAVLSLVSLLLCFAAPFLYLRQTVTADGFKSMLLAASCGWFIFATLWVTRAKRHE